MKMHKLLTQFYATPSEVGELLKQFIRQGLVVVAMRNTPFLISVASAEEELTEGYVNQADQIGVFHGRPDLDVESLSQFADRNSEGLFIKPGRLGQVTLGQSWLSAQSANPQVIKAWRKIAKVLNDRTLSGVWVVNPSTQAGGFYKQFRFTEGALKLFDEGYRMSPPAGTNLVFLRDPSQHPK